MCLPVPSVCVILYAGVILPRAPSVCGLDALVKTCEFELDNLDMHSKTTHVNHVVYEYDPGIMPIVSVYSWYSHLMGKRNEI